MPNWQEESFVPKILCGVFGGTARYGAKVGNLEFHSVLVVVCTGLRELAGRTGYHLKPASVSSHYMVIPNIGIFRYGHSL